MAGAHSEWPKGARTTMRLADTPEEAAFRAEVREFLRKELPAELRRAPSDILQGELAGGGIEVNGKLEPRPGGVGFRPLSGGEAEGRGEGAQGGRGGAL